MRYLPQTKAARKEMMDIIGVKHVDELFCQVPEKAMVKGKVNVPDHMGELEVERAMQSYANQNIDALTNRFFLGAGVYFHHVPASVDYIIQRSEFLTAYTPYQPEIAQGTLQYLFEFQTMISQITGQEVANASLYDGATSMGEAALMAMRVTRKNKVCLANNIHPQYIEVLDMYLSNNDNARTYDAAEDPEQIEDDTACVIIQSPDFFGKPHAYDAWRKACDEKGAMLVVVINEIVSLGMLPAPAEADIVCGEAQSIGVALSYGGPHLGFFACKEKFVRQMPGRLCGITEDADFTVHMSLLGEDGFKHLAALNHEKACAIADSLTAIDGIELVHDTFFNEFALRLPSGTNAEELVEKLAAQKIIAGYPASENTLLIAATEIVTDSGIKALTDAIKEAL